MASSSSRRKAAAVAQPAAPLTATLPASRHPTFYCRLREVTHNRSVRIRPDSEGLWKPSRNPDGHIYARDVPSIRVGRHDDQVYRYKKGVTTLYDEHKLEEKMNDGDVVEVCVATVYFSHSLNRFWVVEANPKETMIGNGIDYQDESDHSNPPSDISQDPQPVNMFQDWKPLTFSHADDYSSQIDMVNAGHPTLNVTLAHQLWPDPLLPCNYHPSERDSRNMNVEGLDMAPMGSLGGNVAAMIALLAFTADRAGNAVDNVLRTYMAGDWWRTPPTGGAHDAYPGRIRKRGIVVHIYAALDEVVKLVEFESKPRFQ